ncbi:hypothetical protein NM688_g1017 [Phlebia brevispora]|uniref:Uncharacterized protein n=1 Tax=Phlebia brevispora TaxID=194682 RepID=A0ACC1TCP6_9APHY|nr:hypothetical protein NM688_g1017 [Phlebia brevispora]
MAHSYKVKIAARLRPTIAGELNDDGVKIEHKEDGVSFISVPNPRDITQIFKFPFTSCYDQSASQEDIFEKDVRPLIDIVYSGVVSGMHILTVTVFAYGVTSSGKTHTMQGTKSQPGIIPRAVEALFERQSCLQRYQASLAVSYMEIYKDEVYDLLVTRDNAPKLPVRENDAGQVFVANLSSIPIESVAEFDRLYARAMKSRSVASTNLNRASSRSHAILTVVVTLTDPAENKTLSGKLNLVDLAGSENNKMTGNDPSRMAESAAINKSLSVLGQVVHALNQGASRIPYRNSKLTRLLQDALGGSSIGLLICNLAPGIKFRQDTLNTLNFAVRTKNIENKPVVNEKDNRPAPKPHFAAVHQPPPKLAPAVLPVASSSSSGSGIACSSRQSLTGSGIPISRPSSAAGSRVPRPSMAHFNSAPSASRLSQIPPSVPVRSATVALTDKEIDERIARAVEAEVARRLEEREREREKEEAERREREEEDRRNAEGEISAKEKEQAHTSTELELELRQRLEELEQKLDNSSQEIEMVDVLSPVSRKRTGRAYVALARSHSEKGNLQLALELYRKAETYVPDNIKLKERSADWLRGLPRRAPLSDNRIIEIEWAVKNGKPFQPSPKKPRKHRTKKAKSTTKHSTRGGGIDAPPPQAISDGSHHNEHSPKKGKGKEKENLSADTSNRSPKRHAAEMLDDDGDSLETPPKAKRGRVSVQPEVSEEPAEAWEQWEPPALMRKARRRPTTDV